MIQSISWRDQVYSFLLFILQIQPQSAVSIIATGGGNSSIDSDRLSSRADIQSPAEKQAAAKMALRKQLEKTLLQVNFSYFCHLTMRDSNQDGLLLLF